MLSLISVSMLSMAAFAASMAASVSTTLALAALIAASAAFEVGYESPSQFSRDYSRLFGSPPRRDVSGLRAKMLA